ncbi:hypothetical protein ABE530_06485 [Brucella sp. TWI559]
MGEKLDRRFQREILNFLLVDYPNLTDMGELFNSHDNAVSVNVHYLEEHGLLKADWMVDEDTGRKYPVDGKITARGLDFLQDDGGLGAVLGVITIKIHDDTIKQLLLSKVAEAEGDEGVRQKLMDKIKGLPAAGLQTIATRLIEKGVEQLPIRLADLAGWLV